MSVTIDIVPDANVTENEENDVINGSLNINSTLIGYDVFVTGVTGFVGMLTLYKLLEAGYDNLDNNNKIYVLIRKSKKYSSIYDRLSKEILTNELFDKYSDMEKDNFIKNKKIIAIEGDLVHDMLGICNDSLEMMRLSDNGIYFIHCAADISFDRPFNKAMNINVNGTYQCIKVAKYCNSQCFLHVSTLYVNSREADNTRIYEKIYNQGFDGNEVFLDWFFKYSRKFDDKYINSVKLSRLSNDETTSNSKKDNNNNSKNNKNSDWANNYVLTKNIAEQMTCETCKNFGVRYSIARLGIVSPNANGIKKGWFLGNGGGFLFTSFAIVSGYLKYFKNDVANGRLDIVPCDYSVDVMLAICAKLLHSPSPTNNIYNVGIAAHMPDNWRNWTFFDWAIPGFHEKVVFISNNKFIFRIREMFYYDLPLFILKCFVFFSNIIISLINKFSCLKFNTLNFKFNKLTKQVKFLGKANTQRKSFITAYDFFATKQWKFDHSNVISLYNMLDNESKLLYNFNVNKFNMKKYGKLLHNVVSTKWKQRQERKKEKEKQEQLAGSQKNATVQSKNLQETTATLKQHLTPFTMFIIFCILFVYVLVN